MPRFDKPKKKGDGDEGDALVVPSQWFEPRCHVCTSDFRRAIDKMLALGVNHSEISRTFGGVIDRRSIGRHAEKHLNYAEASIRRIIEREVEQAQEDAELGISGITKRKVYLETVLHKGMEQALDGTTIMEPKDVMNAIDLLNKFDTHTESVQLDAIKEQFNAFLRAIQEVAAERGDPTLGTQIWERSKEILGVSEPEPAQLKAG